MRYIGEAKGRTKWDIHITIQVFLVHSHSESSISCLNMKKKTISLVTEEIIRKIVYSLKYTAYWYNTSLTECNGGTVQKLSIWS
jgi:hypothetical protein